jgi:hypothetical protein
MKKIILGLSVMAFGMNTQAGTSGSNVTGICLTAGPGVDCNARAGNAGFDLVSGSGGKWESNGICGTFTIGGITLPCGTLKGSEILE